VKIFTCDKTSRKTKKEAFIKLASLSGKICGEVVDKDGNHLAWLFSISKDGLRPTRSCKNLLEGYDIVDEVKWDGDQIAVCENYY